MCSISGLRKVTTYCAATGRETAVAGDGLGSVSGMSSLNFRAERIESRGVPCRTGLVVYAAAIMRREVEIVNELGLHARPAAEFVRCVQKFECEITIRKG